MSLRGKLCSRMRALESAEPSSSPFLSYQVHYRFLCILFCDRYKYKYKCSRMRTLEAERSSSPSRLQISLLCISIFVCDKYKYKISTISVSGDLGILKSIHIRLCSHFLNCAYLSGSMITNLVKLRFQVKLMLL